MTQNLQMERLKILLKQQKVRLKILKMSKYKKSNKTMNKTTRKKRIKQ